MHDTRAPDHVVWVTFEAPSPCPHCHTQVIMLHSQEVLNMSTRPGIHHLQCTLACCTCTVMCVSPHVACCTCTVMCVSPRDIGLCGYVYASLVLSIYMYTVHGAGVQVFCWCMYFWYMYMYMYVYMFCQGY